MENLKKLALLFAFAFVITGIVAFQVRRSRGVTRPPAAVAQPAAAPQENAVPTTPPVEATGNASPPTVAVTRLSIPETGWGRNPFFTAEELAQLRQPIEPTVASEPEAPGVVELPPHVVSAIVTNSQGAWAVINSRVVQVGDRLGAETVRAIESAAVVLESNGKTRRLPLVSGIPEVIERPSP